jgi:tubulin polyglutamylase TTLL9
MNSKKKSNNIVSKGGGKIKYFCTFQNTIADVLASREWQCVQENEDWDFVWADRDWVYNALNNRLDNWQRLNHFRNGKELCRKDLMAKNIKRRRRDLIKEGSNHMIPNVATLLMSSYLRS